MLKRVDKCGSAGLIVYYFQDIELMTWHRWEIGNRVSKKFPHHYQDHISYLCHFSRLIVGICRIIIGPILGVLFLLYSL